MNDIIDVLYLDLDALDYDGPIYQSSPRPPKKISREEIEMSRMTYDGVLLQSTLAFGEVREIKEIAATLFTREGEEVNKYAMSRAIRAARNLVTMKHAKAIPNARDMTHIRSTASEGTQLGALMNMVVRRAHQSRADDAQLREGDEKDEEKVVVADLKGTVHSIM